MLDTTVKFLCVTQKPWILRDNLISRQCDSQDLVVVGWRKNVKQVIVTFVYQKESIY